MTQDRVKAGSPTPVSPFLAWTETVAFCLLFPALGWWLDPDDPFFIAAAFPWIVLAPLLPALRYGFTHGFVGALILIGLMALGWEEGLLPGNRFPAQLGIGLLVLGMIAGEFADTYQRRIDQQRVINDYQRTRLDEFTRNYHLLKVSHDRLEQRLAAGTHSLRGALLDLRRRLTGLETSANPLETASQRIIGIFASFGWIQVAGLYEVHRMHIGARPLATLGELHAVDPFDPLIRHALTKGELASIREELLAGNEDQGKNLLAAVPLVDVNEHVWGLLVVQEMPFIALHEENLRLLAVMGGHIGDILAASRGLGEETSLEAGAFLHHLARALRDHRKYGIPALVLVIEFPQEHPELDTMIELFLSQVRGLDHPWRLREPGHEHVLFLLMPLTAEHELEPYRQRMERQLKEALGGGFETLGIQLHVHPLNRKERVDDILDRLYETAGLDRRSGTGS